MKKSSLLQFNKGMNDALELFYKQKRMSLVRAMLAEPDVPLGLALIWHARLGHIGDVRRLLERGVDIESVDSDGVTPLRAALQARKRRVFSFLLRRGARAHGLKSSALKDAITFGMLPEVKAIIAQGVDPLLNGCVEHDHLVFAAIESGSLDMLAHVLEWESGDASDYVASVVTRRRVDMLRLLVDRGANLNQADMVDLWPWLTPLMYAAKNGDSAMVAYLLKQKVPLDTAMRWSRMTALMLAVTYEHVEIVRMLLDAGANPTLSGELTEGCGFITVLSMAELRQSVTLHAMVKEAVAQWHIGETPLSSGMAKHA